METTIMGYMGIIGIIQGLYRDIVLVIKRENGKEHGNYYNGLCRDYRFNFETGHADGEQVVVQPQ